jgi:type II secretory pathway pseudopilin PulG
VGRKKNSRTSGCLRLLVLLVVLLVGIPILAIIVAIAVPSIVAARRNNNEAKIVSALHDYAKAQESCRQTSRSYADSLTKFAEHKTQFFESDLMAAHGLDGKPLNGYLFKECVYVGGKKLNWTKDFALCAKPETYGKGGYRIFLVRSDGIVWGKDLEKSEFVADFPTDPAKEGWLRAE